MPQDAAQALYKGASGKSLIWRFLKSDGTPRRLADRYVLTIEPLSSPRIILDSDRGEIVLDQETGEVRWPYSPEDSGGMSKGQGTYELMGISDQTRDPWAGGSITVESWL